MKRLSILAVLIATLTSCVTSDVTKNTDERPQLADLPLARWEGRNIYDFFYDVFEEGLPVSTFENEVFSTAPCKGVSWKIIQASRGMNVVGVDIPEINPLEWRDSFKRKSEIPFPIDEAVFVVNPHLGVTYMKGQQFQQPVIFAGYSEGFVEYAYGETNEIKKLVFLTAQGVDEMVDDE